MRKLAMLLGAIAALTFGTAAQAATATYNMDILVQTAAASGVTVTDGHILGTGTLDTVNGLLTLNGTNTGTTTINMTSAGFGVITVQSNLVLTIATPGVAIPTGGTPSQINYGPTVFNETGTTTCTSQTNFIGCMVAGYAGLNIPLAQNTTYPAVSFDLNATGPNSWQSNTFVIMSDANRTTSWTINLTDGVVAPEPASMLLLGGSLAGLAFLRRRKA